MLIATLALGLLPCAVTGSAMASYTMLAQLPIGPQQAAEALADKSMAYWFIVLAGIAIVSWTWIFKWLLNQLELQRRAHAAATDQLIDFLKTDHTSTSALLVSTQSVLAANQQVLGANQQVLATLTKRLDHP